MLSLTTATVVLALTSGAASASCPNPPYSCNRGAAGRWGMAVIVAFTTVFTLVTAARPSTAQPAAASIETSTASTGGHVVPSPQKAGLRGHGFVRDNNGFTTLDAPNAGSFTVAFGIDNRGRTVGGYVDEQGKLHGFLTDKETFTLIDFPGAQGTFVSRINDQGQMVGAYSNDPDTPLLEAPHGFLLNNGVFTKVDVPGAVETRPYGINSAGHIVGEYVDEARRSHGFLLILGNYTTIDVPGSPSIWATDIDDYGRIVGISFGGAVRGFLRDANGTISFIDAPALPPPPGRPELPATQPFGINNLGQVAGVFTDADGVHGFVMDSNGVFATIQPPDAAGDGTFVLGINDEGQLAGAYDMVAHGYLQDEHGHFTTIDHPDAVGETVISGVNNRGQMALSILDATATLRGFLRDNVGLDKGSYTAISVPGALSVGTNKVNGRGQIVGAYSTITNRNHAFPTRGFLFDRGAVTLIDFPGATHTNPVGIDNRGQIVGVYADAAGNFHGFLRSTNGNFTTMDVPGATRTEITAVNDRGQIVGGYADSVGIFHGFLLDHGVVTNIDAAGATLGTELIAINNRGEILGAYSDDARSHGFLFSNGKFTKMTAPGAFLETLPFDVDDRGRIVGFYN